MCIEYSVRTNRPKTVIYKLLKRRAVLRAKVGASLSDFCISDETLRVVLSMEDAESLVCEQIKLIPRTLSRVQYESAGLLVKKAMLLCTVDIDGVVTVGDLDMVLLEVEYLSKRNNIDQHLANLEFLSQIECESATKIKRLVDFGCTFGAHQFMSNCIHDVQEVCGKIEDTNDSEAKTLTGLKKFKFTTERHIQTVLQSVCGYIEGQIAGISGLLKTLRRYEAQFKVYMDTLTKDIMDIASTMSKLCKVALEGGGWEKTQNILLSFYQSAILFMRLIIKTEMAPQVDELLIQTISADLTKAIYLLIPVAHQLDHERMKSVYEMGKGLGKKDGDKAAKKTSKWDGMMAREASRLPRLIFLLETFDCLVVKLSIARPELSKHVYRSTSRDFRINMDQVEAALVASEGSDIESGPEDAVI